MINKDIIVESEDGIGLRKAANFAVVATGFKSHITLEKGDAIINGKSILGVISLALIKGDKLTIMADGIDEKESVERLSGLFK